MKYRVLIVDDYEDAAEATSTLLTILGHVCRTAASATEALAAAEHFTPDIAFVDLGLPDISGFDLAHLLREQLTGRPLYLAALTGLGTPDDLARTKAAGFDQHVVKPASKQTLCAVLADAETKLPH